MIDVDRVRTRPPVPSENKIRDYRDVTGLSVPRSLTGEKKK